jgi:hypothetical protein
VSLGVYAHGRFPRAAEEFASAFGIAVPENIGCSCLHTRAPCLILKTARFIRERGDEGDRDGALLCSVGVFFSVGFGFLLGYGADTQAKTQRECGDR